MTDLGTYLKERRANKGISIRKLAELTDVSHSYISQLENNKRDNPKPYILRVLSEALDAPYLELMNIAGYTEHVYDSLAESFGQKPSEVKRTKEGELLGSGSEVRTKRLYLDKALQNENVTIYYNDKLITKDEKESIDQLIQIHLKGR